MKDLQQGQTELTAADRYAALWEQSDERPDLRAFLDRCADLTPNDLAEVLLVDQSFRWRRRCELPVEDYVAQWSCIADDSELRLDLVYGEIRAMLDRGETLNHKALAERFPEFRERLLRLAANERWGGAPASDRDATGNNSAEKSTVVLPPHEHDLPLDPKAPLTFSDFELKERLGGGAMGEVFRAEQKSLGKYVAIKLLKRIAVANEHELVERFLREGRAVAAVKHPNIVDVHGIGRCPDGGYFLVMDLIDGESLDSRMAEGPISWQEAVRIVSDVARAIAHANERGVIHRDLKPSNVLLDDQGNVLLTDFGLAKLWGVPHMAVSTPGQIVGTPQYMAPEQVDSHRWGEVGPAADVYGLGALLYGLLVEAPPAEGDSLTEVFAWITSERTPVLPRSIRPEIPQEVEAICLKCLAKDPKGRYASAREVAAALELAGAVTVSGKARFGKPPAPENVRRRNWVLGGIALAAVLVLAAGLWPRWFGPPPTPPPVRVTWKLDVYRGGQRDKRVCLTDSPGPVFTDDRLRVHLQLSRASYAYVFWVDSEGTVQQLYPGDSDREEPVREVSLPVAEGSVLPVTGKPGTEVCAVVVRDSPLESSVDPSAKLRPPAEFPPLGTNTILMQGESITSTADVAAVDGRQAGSKFPPPEAWLAGERYRGVGSPEPLKGPAALKYFDLWQKNLPSSLGAVHYLAIPHI